MKINQRRRVSWLRKNPSLFSILFLKKGVHPREKFIMKKMVFF